MNGGREIRFQRGHLRPRRGQQRAGLLHIQITGQTVGKAVAGDGQFLRLRGDVLVGNRQAALIPAHLEIIVRHFAQQRHHRAPAIKFGGGEIGPGGFLRPAFATEHINFP